MLFLLDANAISDLMREHPIISARLASAPPTDDAITCTIVRGEILHGLARLPGRKATGCHGLTSRSHARLARCRHGKNPGVGSCRLDGVTKTPAQTGED